MRLVASLSLAALTACSTPPRASGTEASPPASGPRAVQADAVVEAPQDPRAERRSRDQAITTWGEPHDLASHLGVLRSLDATTDASCRNAELVGASVAAQVEAFQPGDGVSRELGCSGTRCRIRLVSVGQRRMVGLEIFYTRTADGRAAEVDCYPMRGG